MLSASILGREFMNVKVLRLENSLGDMSSGPNPIAIRVVSMKPAFSVCSNI